MLILRLLINALAVYVAARIVPGITLEGVPAILITTVVLGVLNTFVRPIVALLTLPVSILTFGLFLLVINAALVLLAAMIVPGFAVAGFWAALLFSLVVSVVGAFLSMIAVK